MTRRPAPPEPDRDRAAFPGSRPLPVHRWGRARCRCGARPLTTVDHTAPEVSAVAPLARTVLSALRDAPEGVCLYYPKGRRGFTALSNADAAARSLSTAAALARAGIRPGHRVAVLTRDPVELGTCVLTLTGMGAVPVLVDGSLPLPMMRRCLAAAAPDALLAEPLAHVAARLLGWGGGTVRHRVVAGPPAWPGRTLDRLRRAVPPWQVMTDSRDDAPAMVVFTSGATGPPRGVLYRHGTVRAQVQALPRSLDLAGRTVVAAFVPAAVLGPLLGATTVIPRLDLTRPTRVRARALADAVNRTGADTLLGSPALLDRLARHCVRTLTPLPTLRDVFSFGASLPYAVLDRLRVCLTAAATVHSVYGATEALPVSTIDHRELLPLRSATARGHGVCLGRPVPGVTVRVLPLDPLSPERDTEGLPCGVAGELAVAGANVSPAYLDPADTRAAKAYGAYGGVVHRMGDVGSLDAQGRVWFYGRLAHRLRTAEGDVFTERVEPALDALPGVRRTALVGVGAATAQRPVVIVEPEPGAPRAARAMVRRAIQEALEGLERPVTGAVPVLFHRSLPVDHRHGAKIDRARLARWAAARLT
ncbi:AMP-binding protein [Streptomyces sp. ISL-11]|uniref:AMP-binding protein n=1 Tax=Streptomyces sp. ISL-11 TaxID=2819174 RepID=UPI001BE5C9A1|nr:AMP-binding protein [Streptomyces sp. ISL-11]MBT2384318.1 AMP-binding protein [Streptomyces sp. ISL-11]